MGKNGQVLKIYPLLGIAQSLLLGEGSLLRCGAGWINYAIQTDGQIVPCPVMWGLKRFYLGHISSASPQGLRRVLVGAPCPSCRIFNLCGGRCLYTNVVKRWDVRAYGDVCCTVRNLINSVKEELPRIRKLIDDGTINQKDFEFMRYNGCEIIP
jgi:radical SAM protein with 4Fe4S-binding SPASM domain